MKKQIVAALMVIILSVNAIAQNTNKRQPTTRRITGQDSTSPHDPAGRMRDTASRRNMNKPAGINPDTLKRGNTMLPNSQGH